MRLDSQLLFSDAQKITETGNSDNVVKLASVEHGLTEVSYGKPIPLLIQVVADFEGITSLKVGVETDDNEEFGSAKTLVEATLELADLKAGKKFPINQVPAGCKGFMRLKYTVEGEGNTNGAITAGIVDVIDNSFQDM